LAFKFVKRLEERKLQWFDHVKRMDRTRTLRSVLELKFKGKGYMGQPRTRWVGQVLYEV
jgi:hypothetical protein